MRARVSFKENLSFRGILFVDNATGKPLYVKAKEYLDREKLGFQSVILQKAFDRVIGGIFQENPVILTVISEKMRGIIIKKAEKNTLVVEIQHENAEGFPPIEISPKTLANVIKQPQKFLSQIEDPLLIMDEKGKIAWENDPQERLRGSQSTADCITIMKTATNIDTQIFKEKLSCILLITQEHLFVLFPILNFIIFIAFVFSTTNDFEHLCEGRKNSPRLKPIKEKKLRKFLIKSLK